MVRYSYWGYHLNNIYTETEAKPIKHTRKRDESQKHIDPIDFIRDPETPENNVRSELY